MTLAWSSHHQICTTSWLSLYGPDLGQKPRSWPAAQKPAEWAHREITSTSSLMLSQGVTSRGTGHTAPSPSRSLKTMSLGGECRPAACLHHLRSGRRLKIQGRCSRCLARDRRPDHCRRSSSCIQRYTKPNYYVAKVPLQNIETTTENSSTIQSIA
jgi:hypothetical protein